MSADLEEILKDVQDAIGPIDGPISPDNSPGIITHSKNESRGSIGTTFPTEMNCSQVFDQLLKCYSIGGQIRNYYRYGEISYCLDKREKLMFCLGTKLQSEVEQKNRIRKWHMSKLAEQQTNQQSSESIWSGREKPLRMPFREDSENYLNKSNN